MTDAADLGGFDNPSGMGAFNGRFAKRTNGQ
jgi:hypothetical protein